MKTYTGHGRGGFGRTGEHTVQPTWRLEVALFLAYLLIAIIGGAVLNIVADLL